MDWLTWNGEILWAATSKQRTTERPRKKERKSLLLIRINEEKF